MGVLQDLETKIVSPIKLQQDGVPSISLAILENASLSTHVISNGNENPDTLYQCGSISKAITAMGIARMVDSGQLFYDTKMVDILPKDIPETFLDSQTAHLFDLVTVRMCLTHTSGLSQPYDRGQPGNTELPTKEQSIQGHPSTKSIRLRFGSMPGAQVLYCSGTFTLLELAMEHITGEAFPELMQELVMKPLGMERTFYGDLAVEETNYTKPHLNGFQPTPSGVHRFSELAAVGAWSTATDMIKMMSALQQSLHQENGFLSPTVAKEVRLKTLRTTVTKHP